jgi:hypothetical protein
MNTASNIYPIQPADVTVSLANTALLVKLTVTMWSANAKDKKAGKEVMANHGVKSQGGARVYKSLLPNSKLHSEIESLVGEARRTVAALTLPWSDGGERILNVAALQQFSTTVSDYKRKFDNSVAALIGELQNEITKAAFQMGTLFDPKDYPTEREVRSKYSFKYEISPLPTTADFRVDMPREMAELVKAQYLEAGQSRIETAMADAWSRMHAKLAQLVDRLSSDEDGGRKIFKGGLLESAHELVDTLQHLNVTCDPKLEQARLGLKQALRGLTTDQVRTSTVARLDVAEEVKKVMDQFAMLSL